MRVLITIDGYEGQAVVTYNQNQVMIAFENNLVITSDKAYHLAKEALLYSTLKEFAALAAKVKLREIPLNPSFADFYDAYAYKEGKTKAEASWNKLSQTEQLAAFVYITKFNNKLRMNNVAKPYPATYLNQKRWND